MKKRFGITILAAVAAVVLHSPSKAEPKCEPACQEGEVCRRVSSQTDEYVCLSTDQKVTAEETGSQTGNTGHEPPDPAEGAGKKPIAAPHVKPAAAPRAK